MVEQLIQNMHEAALLCGIFKGNLSSFVSTQFKLRRLTFGRGCWRQRGRWRWQAGAGDAQVTVSPSGCEAEEARLVGGDVAVDPGIILRHFCIDSWEIGQSTFSPKTHDSYLHPATVLLGHHWTAWVSLWGEKPLGERTFAGGQIWHKRRRNNYLTCVPSSITKPSADHVVCDVAHAIVTVTLSRPHNRNLHLHQVLWGRKRNWSDTDLL